MKRLLSGAALAGLLALSTTVQAAEPPCPKGYTCVRPEDMETIASILQESKCLKKTKPTFKLDGITIVVDREGRIYGSGSDPVPYRLHMQWCTYDVEGSGDVKILAARRVEPDWGFRLRWKFTTGLMPLESHRQDAWQKGIDAGLLLDMAYWRFLNANVHLGFRSFGVGVGADLTTNFGGWIGYTNTWGEWRHNVMAGLYFGF